MSSTLEKTRIRVSDYMTQSLMTISPEQSIEDAVAIMVKNSFSGLPVADEDGNLVGIISEHDCIRAMLACAYHEESSGCGLVEDFMIREVDSVDVDADIVEVSQRIINERKRRFPVLDDGRLVGQISRRDLMRALLKITQNA